VLPDVRVGHDDVAGPGQGGAVAVIDGVPLPAFESLTPAGLVILLFILLYFERVVPIGRLRDAQKAADILRQTSEQKDAVIKTQGETIRVLTDDVGKTVAKVMGELQHRAGVTPHVAQAQEEDADS
jgi:hypothetical protein